MVYLNSFILIDLYSPSNVGNSTDDRVTERVTSDFQHAACNEQEEQKDSAQDHNDVHPHSLSVEKQKQCEKVLFYTKHKRTADRMRKLF